MASTGHKAYILVIKQADKSVSRSHPQLRISNYWSEESNTHHLRYMQLFNMQMNHSLTFSLGYKILASFCRKNMQFRKGHAAAILLVFLFAHDNNKLLMWLPCLAKITCLIFMQVFSSFPLWCSTNTFYMYSLINSCCVSAVCNKHEAPCPLIINADAVNI